jgi:hypothetical protein
LNLDRATPRPLRLSNTETNSDGSSVERLYKDFFSPIPPPGNPGPVSPAPPEDESASIEASRQSPRVSQE